jgi:hypothetical protein
MHLVLSAGLALIAHLLVAGFLLMMYFDVPEEEGTPIYVRFVTGRPEGTALVEQPKGDPKAPEERAPAPPPAPEPPKPEPPKTEPPARTQPLAEKGVPPAPEAAKPAENPGAGSPAESPAAPVLGAGEGPRAGGLPAKVELSDREIELDPTAAIRRRRGTEVEQLRAGTDRDILVVSGAYDHVQEVLEKLEIPHRVIEPERLSRTDLSKCRILLINCHTAYSTSDMAPVDSKSVEKEIATLEEKAADLRKRCERTKDKSTLYKLNVDLLAATSKLEEDRRKLESSAVTSLIVERLQEFVKEGGYLFTSDWGITLVDRAFPGFIRNGGLVGPRTVTLRPKAGMEKNALLEDVFPEPSQAGARASKHLVWEVDSGSFLIRVDKPLVETLVEGEGMSKYPAVAVAFPVSGGKVLHVLSHFKKQATRQGDYALQNMLLNFMMERVKR